MCSDGLACFRAVATGNPVPLPRRVIHVWLRLIANQVFLCFGRVVIYVCDSIGWMVSVTTESITGVAVETLTDTFDYAPFGCVAGWDRSRLWWGGRSRNCSPSTRQV